MKISYLPALRMVFTTDDARPPLTVFQPYAVLPTEALEDRAAQEECGSLLELGERYYFGTGVEQNYETALSYLHRAAKQNAQDAEYLIAECYRCGYGVAQDYAAYFEWIFRAAEHGSWMAMFHVSAAYHDGKAAYDGFGVDADLEKCFFWSIETEKSIHAYWRFYNADSFVDFVETKSRLMQAYVRAASQISEHYANGVGTKQDLSKAVYWLKRGKKFVTRAIGDREIPMLDTKIAELNARIAAEKQSADA
ncbi:MAG: sel1 repeat family protein [Oscillospiraceae bacterium]|nr:sel1 repeat family protein [Oscillospiraceae bacterium]